MSAGCLSSQGSAPRAAEVLGYGRCVDAVPNKTNLPVCTLLVKVFEIFKPRSYSRVPGDRYSYILSYDIRNIRYSAFRAFALSSLWRGIQTILQELYHSLYQVPINVMILIMIRSIHHRRWCQPKLTAAVPSRRDRSVVQQPFRKQRRQDITSQTDVVCAVVATNRGSIHPRRGGVVGGGVVSHATYGDTTVTQQLLFSLEHSLAYLCGEGCATEAYIR